MTHEDTFDVIVVGSGGGALTAAALAAAAGLSTVVLERTELIGGTSAYSGGACWLPGSRIQQQAGLPDSTDSARQYLAAVLREPDQVRVEAFLADAPALVERLEADDLFAFEWLPFPEYYDAPGRVPMGRSLQPVSIARSELPEQVGAWVRPPVERDRAGAGGRRTLSGGQSLIGRLLAMAVRDGAQVRVGHRVQELISTAGRVSGVRAHTEQGDVVVHARVAVILGAGGFEGDQQLRDARGVSGSSAWTMAPTGTNTGEVIDAAVALGAATDLLSEAWYCPGLLHPDGHGSFTVGFRGGIMVDATGRRYGNECLPYDQFGRVMARTPQAIPSWLVFDSREGGRLPAIAMPEGEPQEHLAAGTWVQADSVAELAAAMAVPVEALSATVARFNGFAASGVDEDFGRGLDEYDRFFTGGEGPNPALQPIDQPPYYAARFVLSDLGTKGGLRTDRDARVLDADGQVIPGLFACGNSAANLAGAAYPAPGVPLGTAMVAAYRAVRLLAASSVSAD